MNVSRRILAAAVPALLLMTVFQLQAEPEFDANGDLKRPANYREWVFLSSGLSMNYGSVAQANPNLTIFDNVFVEPAAYAEFLKTGTWPERTQFVLELRRAATEGSINKAGRFQKDVVAIEVEVKDSARFPGKWGFFGFSNEAETSKVFDQSMDCYSCHRDNGAVDNTFVQFYPTLLELAREKGTLTEAYLKAEAAEQQ